MDVEHADNIVLIVTLGEAQLEASCISVGGHRLWLVFSRLEWIGVKSAQPRYP